jgi:BCD family chlorophyll transporter-like MFS transporter
VGTLTAIMAVARQHDGGIALGAWGAVTATTTGVAVALGGAIRDVVSGLAESGQLGPALTGPAPGYGAVYHIEILLLFVTLAVIGPLARHSLASPATPSTKFGLAAHPG